MKLSNLPLIAFLVAIAVSAVSLTLYFANVHPLVSLSASPLAAVILIAGAFLLGLVCAIAGRAWRCQR